MKHPADELMEDLDAGRLYGERSWNPLEQEPFAPASPARGGLWPNGLPWDVPWLEDGRRASGGTADPGGPAPAFWPLALGMLLGGMLAHRLGGPLLLVVGVLVGLRLGLAVSAGQRARGG